ncbi:MAG: hypothetical protein JNL67_08635 [Planctomycetaceae bacterium]|nr:hypothetical protein [Planctomycetaceae bacterium]
MSHHAPAVVNDAQPHYQDINTPVVILLTAVSAIVTYAMIAAAQGYYFQWKNEAISKQNAQSVSKSSTYLAEEKAVLAEGSTERKIKPIGDSMKKLVQELGAAASR